MPVPVHQYTRYIIKINMHQCIVYLVLYTKSVDYSTVVHAAVYIHSGVVPGTDYRLHSLYCNYYQ
jgi:hypothetical protein